MRPLLRPPGELGSDLNLLPGGMQRCAPAAGAHQANLASLSPQASSLERQSPRVASCLTHSLCPGEPSLQTTAGTFLAPSFLLPRATRAFVVVTDRVPPSLAEPDTVCWLPGSRDRYVGRVARALPIFWCGQGCPGEGQSALLLACLAGLAGTLAKASGWSRWPQENWGLCCG